MLEKSFYYDGNKKLLPLLRVTIIRLSEPYQVADFETLILGLCK